MSGYLELTYFFVICQCSTLWIDDMIANYKNNFCVNKKELNLHIAGHSRLPIA